MGINMYQQDYDGVTPSNATWCDAILPYVRSDRPFVCSYDKDAFNSYAFNARLSARKLANLSNNASLAMIFEAKSQWNQVGDRDIFVARHDNLGVVGFADLHVKAVNLTDAAQMARISWNPIEDKAAK